MPVEIRVPQLGESIVEATVARWLKKEGDPVTAGEAIAELETDKVAVEVPADASGILQQISQQEGDTVAIGAVLGLIGEAADAAAAPAPVTATSIPPAATSGNNGSGGDPLELAATPIARRFAEDSGIDLALVRGTGPAGRVTKDDVANYLESKSAPTPAIVAPVAAPSPAVVPPAASAPRPASPETQSLAAALGPHRDQ